MDTTNEPVAIPFAWYCAWLGDSDEPVWEQYEECHPATKQWDNFPDKIIPLYTHPHSEESVKVKELTLTEDEIDDVWAACSTGESDTIDMHLFAEAILRKAQEK